jgi:hypothetical protein
MQVRRNQHQQVQRTKRPRFATNAVHNFFVFISYITSTLVFLLLQAEGNKDEEGSSKSGSESESQSASEEHSTKASGDAEGKGRFSLSLGAFGEWHGPVPIMVQCSVVFGMVVVILLANQAPPC